MILKIQYVALIIAAITEIAGCYTFWAWFKLGKSILWLIPGTLCLWLFAYSLTVVETEFAGRAYAFYGGIYICFSLFWMYLAEGNMPDKWDILGAVICLIGASVILLVPRST
ncbi:YnfA family protein [Rickettsiales endosymbiont of Stachyamoeba lipophora]|uniref:YnfA family protein n=1 Tax=Rickettsiales endosymbiont of Stachyamoeba lipophora TaxID=2486578 RepID=UPI000F650B9B|nr:YnfA family protein [Rickettsiales endosymbiont of Stachyamoeba lipophora]AZL16438.1 YnfA family protein [Rickettsiales endosymbiont of Stachyamoeba lipophora]